MSYKGFISKEAYEEHERIMEKEWKEAYYVDEKLCQGCPYIVYDENGNSRCFKEAYENYCIYNEQEEP